MTVPCRTTPSPPAPPIPIPDPSLDRATDARRLSERLLRSDSAARTLLEWCGERMIGGGPIRAVPVAGDDAAVPPDLLEHLGTGESPRHRRVVLARGSVGLSDLDLWWLPGRLPAALGAALETTDHAFGVVVAPLRPRRRMVFVGLASGRHFLEHRAVVETTGDAGYRPVAAVRERYRAGLGRRG